ncbi:hypothetical protein BOTBODRAFT_56307 [Botryobasidium botryosum FD-172 SS1]|uniref:amidase n=1 Tax=Botryobasidium botryosum (strain FD-172 SS1) TaxID=930990 RepID=A0A067MBQ2_BOTB1|nr:hypothetical protein BOTBODRAFT_56307 [Botryobasidium botryosum FD-172 SS1]
MWPFWVPEWQATIDGKRAARDRLIASVPPQPQPTPPQLVQAILGANASEIVRHIQNEDEGWTATNVVRAYIERAIVAQSKTNCLTEILFAEALAEAEALDKEFRATKKIKGPLHGVPVSFKDLFHIKGFDHTIGFTDWANHPAADDAMLVRQIRAAGGIIIAKTNVPQTMVSFECSNPLWGRTLNPWNPDYTCGGSSGGEAALLSSDGAVLGFGSDIGGSLRIPAHFCGIYSLKPGADRYPLEGCATACPGFSGVTIVAGPMARSVSDLELACRVVFGSAPPSPFSLPPLPYRDVELPKKLRFGYYTADGYVKASPACQRAVLETVAALRREGHECMEFQPPDTSEAMQRFSELTSADGYKTIYSYIKHDALEPNVSFMNQSHIPGSRSFFAWFVRYVLKDEIAAKLIMSSGVKSVDETWKIKMACNQYVRRWYEEVWEKDHFDAIIAPPSAAPALPHGSTKSLAALAGATILYNIVDSPVGIIPVLRVDPAKDQITDEWRKFGAHGSVLLENELYHLDGGDAYYDPEKMAGLPVGIQLVGRRWEDEKLLAMMHVVDKALGPREFGPGLGAR